MKRTKTSWTSWLAIVVGFVAVTIGGFRSTAWSEDVAPPSQENLEERVKILERKLEISAEEEAAKSKDRAIVKASAGDGFQIQSADKNFALKLKLLIQTDARSFIQDQAHNQTNAFLVRRARTILEGTLYGFNSFLITPDFAANGKTLLFDAYLDVAPWTFAKLRAGKFKPPIGLEHLQSDAYVIFPERSMVSNLVPNRDTGLQFFGDVWNGALSYAAAFTNGVGDNNVNTTATAPVTSDTDNNDGKEGTARLVAKPFKNSAAAILQGVGIGFSASYAKQSTLSPTYVSPGVVSVFTPAAGAQADGAHRRWAPDLSWYFHSLSVYSEWVQSEQVWRVGAVRSNIVNQALGISGSYVLTGEDASYTGVKPRKPFDPKNGTWGAFEIAARYQNLYLDPDNFSKGVTTPTNSVQRADSYGVGLNWYLNNAVRLSSSYDQTQFDKGKAVGDRPTEKVVISRVQLSF